MSAESESAMKESLVHLRDLAVLNTRGHHDVRRLTMSGIVSEFHPKHGLPSMI